jgi:hypothetical protein
MSKQELRELWSQLDAELRNLRTTFDPSPKGALALQYFDEYLLANEFGLALETLCDFLLDSDAPNIATDLLLQLQLLHTKMGVDDNCVRNLGQKGSGRVGM